MSRAICVTYGVDSNRTRQNYIEMPRTISAKSSPARSRKQGKRYPLNMRTTKETRDRLEAAARASGRSLAQEVEYLVGRALLNEEIRESTLGAVYESFGGSENFRLMQLLAGAIHQVEQTTGKSWRSHLDTYQQVDEALRLILHVLGSEAREFPFPIAAILGSPHQGLGRRAAIQQIEKFLQRLQLAAVLIGDSPAQQDPGPEQQVDKPEGGD